MSVMLPKGGVSGLRGTGAEGRPSLSLALRITVSITTGQAKASSCKEVGLDSIPLFDDILHSQTLSTVC